jgi:SHS2 domain-containing protein
LSFALFGHSGDIGVRLAGRTLDDLFREAAAAFTEAITDPARIEPRRSVSLTLESPAPDLLLVDWLSEILYRFEVEQFLVADARVFLERVGSSSEVRPSTSSGRGEPAEPRSPESDVDGPDLGRRRSNASPATAWRLQATLSGEPFDRERHAIKVLIKAVTYHALEVREEADGWHATVVFDI